MRAMILAAGRGERLRPLTDTMPKPMIEAGGRPLIDYHLQNLAEAGFREVVINLAHLGDALRAFAGGGEHWGLQIRYSEEPPGALETGGGIHQALPKLGRGPFLVINGDIWCDYPLARLRAIKCDWAHLVLVTNPEHNTNGDFALRGARVTADDDGRHTFSGIAVYHPRFFQDCEPGRFSVVPMLRARFDRELVTGELYRGAWFDSGTAERLGALRRHLSAS